ncbi:SPOR domain-containing protein [Ramlibacter sp. AN1015]|uniref:SPOR domain-containing protein n=1 Tax=Ramlibacter sp. AN1015 TaxID=3133428 RepID=UPI0030C1BC55
MAFFKFRKGQGASVAAPAKSESVEAMRRRARQRLIGAAVLVLAGVIGFPLLFDTQPRPVAVDIPIEIPDRQRVAALSLPAPEAPAAAGGVSAASQPVTPSAAAPQPTGGRTAGPVTPASPSQPQAAPASGPATTPGSAPVPATAPTPAPPANAAAARADARPDAKPESKPEPRPETRIDAKKAVNADEAARARALLEGRSVPVAAAGAAEERLVVQVGAFAEPAKAREVRQKLERAGVKTYVHVAETKEGPRIRVRAGPFNSRAEADRAAQKIKGLDLPAAILTL